MVHSKRHVPLDCLPANDWFSKDALNFVDAIEFDDDQIKRQKVNLDRSQYENIASDYQHLQFYLSNFIKGSVVKWCFPYNYISERNNDSDSTDIGFRNATKDIQSGSFDITHLPSGTISDNNEIKERGAGTLSTSNSDDDAKPFGHQEELHHKRLNIRNNTLAYVLVGDDFIYVTNTNVMTRVKGGISDCAVMSHTTDFGSESDFRDDIVLIVQNDGYLLSVVPQKINKDKMKTKSKNSIVIQYWNLGAGHDWKIIKPTTFSEEFIVADFEKGIINFFHFIKNDEFELRDSIIFHNDKILSCNFFHCNLPSLFLSTLSSDRIRYYCLEWDSHERKQEKTVHQLTNLQGEAINGSIPISSNKCLLYSNSRLQVVSSNQIMSGEVSFKKFQVPLIKGIRSWYKDNYLLHNLQSQHFDHMDDFNKYNDCTVVSTATGIIFCILGNEKHDLAFYYLTRFKGLKSICSSNAQPILNTKPLYNVVVVSFNRTISLSIDLSQMYPLPIGARNVALPKTKSILSMRTLSSTSDKNVKLIPIPSKKETWLASPSSLSQIAESELLVTRKTKQVGDLFSVFNAYNKIHRILGEKGSFENIIWATDGMTVTNCFYMIDDGASPQFGNADVLLSVTNQGTIFFRIFESYSIQITRNAVLLKPLGSSKKVSTIFKTREPISGSSCYNNKLVFWNISQCNIWYIELDSNRTDFEVKSSPYMEGLLKTFEPSSFNISIVDDEENRDECNIILRLNCVDHNDGRYDTSRLNKKVHYANWKAFTEDEFNFDEYNSSNDDDHDGKLYSVFDMVACSSKFCGSIMLLEDCRFFFSVARFDFSCQSQCDSINTSFKPIDDIKMKALGGDEFVLYTSSVVYLVKYVNGCTQFEEVKIPYRGKAVLLDIDMNLTNDKLLLLYEDGLEIVELGCITWNKNDYLLQHTRSTNKDFLFLEEINRMLVLNKDMKSWYCMNIETGKVAMLDSESLVEDEKIESIFQLTTLDKNNISLLVCFDTIVKYIKLNIGKGQIEVKELDKYQFNSSINSRLKVDPSGCFFHAIKVGPCLDSIMKFQIKSDKIELVKEVEINSKGEIIDFELFEEGIILVSANDNNIWLLKDYDNLLNTLNETVMKHLTRLASPLSPIRKILRLNNKIFAAAINLTESGETLSMLALYDVTSCNEGKDEIDKSVGYIENGDDISIFQYCRMKRGKKLETYYPNLVHQGWGDILYEDEDEDDSDMSMDDDNDDDDIRSIPESLKFLYSDVDISKHLNYAIDFEDMAYNNNVTISNVNPYLPNSTRAIREINTLDTVNIRRAKTRGELFHFKKREPLTDHLLTDGIFDDATRFYNRGEVTNPFESFCPPKNNGRSAKNTNGYYDYIEFDKKIIDISYDDHNHILSVLAHDQSVIQFGLESRMYETRVSNRIRYRTFESCLQNGGYYLAPTKKSMFGLRTDAVVNLPIDRWGRRVLHSVRQEEGIILDEGNIEEV